MSCIDKKNPVIKQWINSVGEYETYKQLVLHNYVLPNYDSFIRANSYKGLTSIERDNIISKYLDLSNYSIEAIDKIRKYSPEAQAAFMRKTFYFAENSNKLQVNEESFHAIFQTILSDKEKERLYSVAEELLNNRLSKYNLSKTELYNRISNESKLKNEALHKYILEEELAKAWTNYATYNDNYFTELFKDKDSSFIEKLWDILKSLFNKLLNIKNNYQKNSEYLEYIFGKISNGDYISNTPISESDINYPSFSSIVITPEDTDKESYILNPLEQTVHYNKILSIANQLYEKFIVHEDGSYYTTEDFVKEAIEIYNDAFLSKGEIGGTNYLLGQDLLEQYDGDEKFYTKTYKTILNDLVKEFNKTKSALEDLEDLIDDSEEDTFGRFLELDSEQSNQVDRETSLPQRVKQIIASTEIFDSLDQEIPVSKYVKDDKGNLTLITFNVIPRRLIDPHKVYSSIVRSSTNTIDEFERLRKVLIYLQDNNKSDDTKTFIDNFLKKVYRKEGSSEELSDRELIVFKRKFINNDLNNYELNDSELFGVVLKSFDLWTRANRTMKLNNSGISVTYDPNFTNVKRGQLDEWQTNWEIKRSKIRSNTLELLQATIPGDILYKFLETPGRIEGSQEEIERQLVALEERNKKVKADVEKYINEKTLNKALKDSYESLSKVLDFYGVNVSNTFKKYIVAEKYIELGINLNKNDGDFGEVYDSFQFEKNEFKLNLHNLSQGLKKLNKNNIKESNPYDESTNEDISSTLNALAFGNSYFDETVLASTFRNAEGKSIYAHQLQTFILKFGNYILKSKKHLEEYKDELLNISDWNKDFLEKNSLWNFYTNELTDKERSRLNLFSYSGLALHEADKDGNFGKELRSVVNDLSPYDFITYQANVIPNEMFIASEGVYNTSTNEYESEPIITVPYFLGSNETSNTQTFFTGRWFQGAKNSEGKWSPLLKGDFKVGNGAVYLAREILDNQVSRAEKFTKLFNQYFNSYIQQLVENQDILLDELELQSQQDPKIIQELESSKKLNVKITEKLWRQLGYKGQGVIDGMFTGVLPLIKTNSGWRYDIDKMSEQNTKTPRGFLIHRNLDGVFDSSGRKIIYSYLYNGISLEEYNKQINESITNGLNSYLKNSFDAFKYTDEEFSSLIDNSYTGVVDNNSNKTIKIKRLGFNSKSNDEKLRFRWNINMTLLNSLFNRELFQRILHGDPSVINKYDNLDPVKRNKGEDAQVSSAYTPLNSKLYNVPAFTEMKVVQHVEADNNDSTYGKDISGVTNKSTNSNDAQTLTSVMHRMQYLHGLKKLNKHLVKTFDKMISGHEFTNSEKLDILNNKVFTNIEKSRLFDSQNDIKTSEALLYKLFTSHREEIPLQNFNDDINKYIRIEYSLNNQSYRVLPKEGASEEYTIEFDINKYQTFEKASKEKDFRIFKFIPISKDLDNKRKLLEGWRIVDGSWKYSKEWEINMMAPVSAHKRLKQDIWDEDYKNLQDYNVHILSTKNYGRQVENPPKTKITDATQQIEILPSNLPETIILVDKVTGEKKEVDSKSVIGEYFNLLASRDVESIDLAIDLIYDSIKDEVSYSDLYSVIRDSLIDTGGDIQMIEMFMTDKKGKAIYNGNLPSIKIKLQQHIFSYLSKDVLSHKVPGDAFAMQSPRGMSFLKKLSKHTVNGKEIISWETISRNDSDYGKYLKKAYTIPTGLTYNGYTYLNEDNKENNTLISYLDTLASGNSDVYFLDELRHLKPRIINGNVENYYSETTLAQRSIKQNIPQDSWKYIQGVRIPSQDRATSANLEVIDFIDPQLGNSISVAKEIQELAGSDFDIDKLYVQFYEGRYEKGKFIEYDNNFEDFIDYTINKNKLLKKKVKEAVEEHPTIKELNKKITNINKKVKLLSYNPNVISEINNSIRNIRNYVEQNKTLLYEVLEHADLTLRESNTLEKALDIMYDSIQKEKDNPERKIYYKNVKERDSLFFKKMLIKNSEVIPNIFYKYKLPSNPSEFEFVYGKTPFKAIKNNKLLDFKKSFLTQDYRFYSTPTDVGYIKNLTEENPLNLDYAKDFTKVADIPLNSPYYDLFYKLRAVAGKVGIGSTVTSNLTWLLLERANVKLNSDYHIYLDLGTDNVITYDKFEKEVKQIKDEALRYVSENNSTIITASTDEAKEGVLAKYNMVGDLLSVFTEGQTLGIHPQLLIYLVNNNYVQQLAEKSLRNPLRLQKNESLLSLIKKEIDDAKFDWKSSPLTLDDIIDTNKNLAVLSTVYKLLMLNQQNKDLAKLIKLKRGFGATFEDYQDLLKAMQRLGINSPILKELNTENNKIEELFQEEIHDTYNLDLTLQGFEQINNQIEKVLPLVDKLIRKIFIENSKNYKLLYKKITSVINPSDYLLSDYNDTFNDALLGTLINFSDDKKINKIKEDLSVELLIGENSVAKNLIKIITEDNNIQNHPLFKKIIASLGFDKSLKQLKRLSKNYNKSIDELYEEASVKINIDNVRLNLFSKLSPEMQTSLMDDFAYFLSLEETEMQPLVDFVKSLYNYFIIKDGMRYSPIGLSKIFPTTMFKSISKLYDDFINNEYDVETLKKVQSDIMFRIARDINSLSYWKDSKLDDENEVVITNDDSKYNTKIFSRITSSVISFNNTGEQVTPNNKYIKYDGYIYLHVGTENKSNNKTDYKKSYYIQVPLLGLDGYKATIANKNIASSTESFEVILNGYDKALEFISNDTIKGYIKTFKKYLEDIVIFENGELVRFGDRENLSKVDKNQEFTTEELGLKYDWNKNINTEVNNNIYSELGNKTQSKNVVIKPWSELKDAKEAVVKNDKINYSEYTNYSGAAQGGDTVWENVGKEFGLGKQVNYRPEDLQKLTKEQLQEVENAYQQAVKDLGRKPLASNTFAGGLVRRDYLQAKSADAVFAVSTIVQPNEKDPKGYINKTNKPLVAGGTGYAVQMAINLGKPVYVFDQVKNKWFVWSNNNFVETNTPTLTKKFAGIGTREINENGKQAIRDVYEKTSKEGISKTISNKPQQLSLFDQLEQDKQLWREIKDKWIESGRTEADFNSMTNEEREHIIKNCL